MYYITSKLPPFYHQMTLDELLFGSDDTVGGIINYNISNTRTLEREQLTDELVLKCNVSFLISRLKNYNKATDELRNRPRKELYREFHIPKKSGGLRKIDAPNEELMAALRNLKNLIEREICPPNGALYHTSAFAYIKKRGTLDAVKRHQSNNSKWFGKFDLSNFFGSTTLDYVIHMLEMIYPFNLILEDDEGKIELTKALELGFLDGGLPQGTPLSPLITNIIMIPIDFKLSNKLRDFNNQSFVYTRYADDFLISSKYDFKFKEVENLIVGTLKEFNAPFILKPEKTRYGSSSGSNWNLGVMLNKDNEITVGYKKKKQFKAMLSSFILDTLNGNPWDLNDVQAMEGYRNYYHMIEPENINALVSHMNEKYNVNVTEMIKEQLMTN